MNRFAKTKKPHSLLRELALPVVLFVGVLLLFAGGLRSVTAATESEQLKSARQAVTRAVIQCYAVEGVYPPDLAYLEQNYGLQVDRQRYIIDYRCFASNIMPDITVLPNNAAA
ncbi:hypothetical protein [Marasmitruncus massiliensis]|uniref:hypothetical protein n=1 Tax=Marasmitruncus massiliensis TaxID=1944642 RepID=UPI000C79E35E|nr:hypothetical protein [Marasmitruncus massiliensis]